MHTTSSTARGRDGTRGWWRAEGATITRSTIIRVAPSRRRDPLGFTLTELLIVIGLIVLVIALAVPAFRAMSGGRSIDAAQNQLAAVLGVARAEAIGLQKVRGVFFYLDPATERVNAALVQEVSYAPEDPPDYPPDYYLDLVPDRDPIALPVGVGLQGIDNASVTGGTRKDDGYVGYNPGPLGKDNPFRFGGVILFDGYGRVVNKFYGFLLGEVVPPAKKPTPTRMAELFGYAPGATGSLPLHFVPSQRTPGVSTTDNQPPQSLFGFVLYDAESFAGQGTDAGDPQFGGATGNNYAGNEVNEEHWLDQNAAPVLINRYNGTLIRGE